jgi:hypothetical protein
MCYLLSTTQPERRCQLTHEQNGWTLEQKTEVARRLALTEMRFPAADLVFLILRFRGAADPPDMKKRLDEFEKTVIADLEGKRDGSGKD